MIDANTLQVVLAQTSFNDQPVNLSALPNESLIWKRVEVVPNTSCRAPVQLQHEALLPHLLKAWHC